VLLLPPFPRLLFEERKRGPISYSQWLYHILKLFILIHFSPMQDSILMGRREQIIKQVLNEGPAIYKVAHQSETTKVRKEPEGLRDSTTRKLAHKMTEKEMDSYIGKALENRCAYIASYSIAVF
jgi:hypothetical protein